MDSNTALILVAGAFVVIVTLGIVAGLLIWWNNAQRTSGNNRQAANKRHEAQKSAESEALEAITDLIPLIQGGKLKEMTPEQTQALLVAAKEKYPNLSSKLFQRTLGQLF